MSIKCKCKIIKQVYGKDNFRIFGCIPLDDANIELNSYGNFTITGDLGMLETNNEYELELEEVESKYGKQYKVLSIPTLSKFDIKDINDLTNESELSMLSNIMTEQQAINLNTAYPNFIRKVLMGEEKEIDYTKINNVAEIRLKSYINKVNALFKYFKLMTNNEDLKFTYGDCVKLCNIFPNMEIAQKIIDENPYRVMIDILGKSFTATDNIIINVRPQFKDSDVRCEYLILHLLEQNENDGNTRIYGNELALYVRDWDKNLLSRMKQVSIDSQKIYYDEKSKDLSLMGTYLAECHIANDLIERLNNSEKWDIDYAKYQHGEYELTDEQMGILKLVCDNNIAMLTGGAGCVDCDTEFFNGTQWKKISDYKLGDKVLQYNNDGAAELVEPLRYIKEPCDFMYHFETKYGLNQTLSDDHNIVYWSDKGKKHECNIDYIINKQSNDGFRGKFATTFKYGGEGIDLTNDEIRLMCAIICDGRFGSKTNWCRINIKKTRKKERLESILNKCNILYKKTIWNNQDKDYNNYSFYAPLRTKLFDDYWYNCNNEQLQIICDEIIYWDGNIKVTKNNVEKRTFSTTEKINADFIQFAFASCGFKTSISVYDRRGETYKTCGKFYIRKSIEYQLSITTRNMVGLNRYHDNRTQINKVSTIDGYKYCFTVPSHTLILRRNNCIFITGNCGKTSSIQSLIQMLDDNDKSYTLVAPTGIASKRLSETTHRKASTIHKLLANDGVVSSSVLIVDEMSMVGVNLLSDLLNNTLDFVKVLFVCDNEQLASISCGNIVQDLLLSNIIPISKLTKVFRYGTNGLATVATDIRNGENYLTKSLAQFNDYKFLSVENEPIEQIMVEYKKMLKKYSFKDILVLSPFNVGSFGTYAINSRIQAEINPPLPNEILVGRKVKEAPNGMINFRKGDKVINKKNNYTAKTMDSITYNKALRKMEKELEEIKDFDGGTSDNYYNQLDRMNEFQEQMPNDTFVMNGEIGYILNIDDDKNVYVQFDEDIIVYDQFDLQNLLLAYAISIHAIQGSQSKAVMVITHKQHSRMLTKNLLYVADTRAEEYLIEIGDKSVIKNALTISENKNRKTWLLELLKESYENGKINK
jgi:hypothetical protein